MKRKGLILLATIVVSTLAVAIYATAKQPTTWDYYAYGYVDDYQDAPSAKIMSGFWNLKVQDKKVWLDVYYLEKNKDYTVENSPDNSVDIFEMSIHGTPIMMYENADLHKLYIFAKFRIEKSWATFDGTYQPKQYTTWRMLIIDFDTETVLLDGYPPDPFSDPPPGSEPENPSDDDWDIDLTLEEYSYPPLEP